MSLFAAEIADQSVGVFAVGALVLGALGAFAYLIRNAFEGTTKAVEALGLDLKSLRTDISKADGDRRVIEAQLSALQRTVDRLERELGELSEGIAK